MFYESEKILVTQYIGRKLLAAFLWLFEMTKIMVSNLMAYDVCDTTIRKGIGDRQRIHICVEKWSQALSDNFIFFWL